MMTHTKPESPEILPFTSYFVAVDLSRTEHDLRPIMDCLSHFPDLLKVQASAWIVSVLCSAEELFATLQAALPEGGRLWMSETAGACGWIAGDYRTALQIRSRVRI
ncbi:hypothetical protein GGQ88_003510 [Novosphingobium hassiacum]|uniref:Uncharacterized protein n=1 Tax=Novosphingobium hassiacum TaxID=173676 RepID=A0A7W6A099_9SPHN|nr:hypothetical protein [Novosphingobium hassiacum]MBB3862212.1 hypothetical protein [Novosphingobium hassiacum]